MSAPTLTSQTGSTWTDQVNTDEVTGTLTWNSGDRILVVGFTEDQSLTLGTPTATGLTFGDLGTPITTANSCWMHAWQATAGSSGSGAVTGPRATGTGTGMRGIEAYAYGNCTGFTRTDGAGANSTQTVSVTRGQANSGMVFASADWSAGGTGGLAWTPAGQTQDQAAHNASGATAFAAHWGDQGSTGTTSYGTSGLAGTVFNKFAVEVLGTVSAGPVPWAPRQQARTPDPGETYWAQSRRLDMGPLAAANPLAIPLLNASSVAQRAAVLARTSWSRQVPQLANQGAAAGVAYDPTLAPPMRSLAAYTSRLVYPQQRSYPAAPDPTTTVGAGALGAWWSVDDGAHFGPAQRRQLADQSSAAGTPFDPTLAGYGWVAELAAVTHRDRRPATRQPQSFAAVDDVLIPRTGPVVYWRTVDGTAVFLGQRRRADVPAPSYDPTTSPQSLARLVAAVLAPRPQLRVQQRPYAAPDLTMAIGTGAVGAWWSVDDWLHFGPGQRRDAGFLALAQVALTSPNPELFTTSSGRDLGTSSFIQDLITETRDRDLEA